MKRSVLLLLLLALAGCSDDPDGAVATRTPAGPTAEAGTVDCGRVEVRSATGLPATGEVACMRDALRAHRAAEVVITLPTVEGDPIHRTYRLSAAGRVALTIDSREDAFGGSGAGIHQVACTKPEWLPGATCPPRPPKPSEPATWILDRQRSTIDGSTTEFVALVTRVGCASGRTGKVLPPLITFRRHSVVVTFNVARLTGGAYDCQGNDRVSYRVRLGEPLGARLVLDGQCANQPVSSYLMCRGKDVRIHPPGWQEAMGGQD